jgi:hypothetical protein
MVTTLFFALATISGVLIAKARVGQMIALASSAPIMMYRFICIRSKRAARSFGSARRSNSSMLPLPGSLDDDWRRSQFYVMSLVVLCEV